MTRNANENSTIKEYNPNIVTHPDNFGSKWERHAFLGDRIGCCNPLFPITGLVALCSAGIGTAMDKRNKVSPTEISLKDHLAKKESVYQDIQKAYAQRIQNNGGQELTGEVLTDFNLYVEAVCKPNTISGGKIRKIEVLDSPEARVSKTEAVQQQTIFSTKFRDQVNQQSQQPSIPGMAMS